MNQHKVGAHKRDISMNCMFKIKVKTHSVLPLHEFDSPKLKLLSNTDKILFAITSTKKTWYGESVRSQSEKNLKRRCAYYSHLNFLQATSFQLHIPNLFWMAWRGCSSYPLIKKKSEKSIKPLKNIWMHHVLPDYRWRRCFERSVPVTVFRKSLARITNGWWWYSYIIKMILRRSKH